MGLKELARSLAFVVHALLPKFRYAVLWSESDYEDSLLALERSLQDTRVRRVVLLMSDKDLDPPVALGPKTVRVAKYTVRGWLYFAMARYVFFTHRCFARRFPRRVVSVNVWHGMPIKRIGWMLDGDGGIDSRHAVATSEFWAPIMQRAMEPHGGVLVTGLPRNDRLWSGGPSTWARLGFAAELGSARRVVWLPTYRKSAHGLVTVDGRPTGSPFEMEDIDPDRFNEHLRANGATCVLKPHPMSGFTEHRRYSNLLIVDDVWLKERALSLYELIGSADVLVSDVSSVTVDYLVLDRPVLHAMADLEAYGATRGFSIEPVTDYLMGPVATSGREVQDVLSAIWDGQDPEGHRRRNMRELFHADPDDGSTQRLLRAVGLDPVKT